MPLYLQKKQVAVRSVIDTRHRHHLVVGFLEGFSLQGYTQVGVEDAQYLSIYSVIYIYAT